MKRAPHLVAATLMAACTVASMSGTALAGPEHVDPGVDFHLDPKDPNRVIIHEGARFTTDNFARTFKVNPFTIRSLNPEGTLATCFVQGKMKVSPGLTGMELRKSNAIWENCPEPQRFVYIVPGSVIRLREESARSGREAAATPSAPTSSTPSPAPPKPPFAEKPERGPPPHIAASVKEMDALRSELVSQESRIRTLEARNHVRSLLLVAGVFLIIVLAGLWWDTSRRLLALRRMRHEHESVGVELEQLKAEHALLGSRHKDLTANANTAQEALRNANADLLNTRAALMRSEDERAGQAQVILRLRTEDIPKARDSIPPAMLAELMSARKQFDAIERRLTGNAPSMDMRDLPIGERAKRIRELTEGMSSRVKNVTTRAYLAAHLDPPAHEPGILDMAPLESLPERIQHFYDSVESQSMLFAKVAAVPELDGESQTQVLTYAELLAENTELKARLGQCDGERPMPRPVAEAGTGESQTRSKAEAFSSEQDSHDLVAALLAERVDENYAPDSVSGTSPLGETRTEESGVLGPLQNVPEQRLVMESGVHVHSPGHTVVLDEPAMLGDEITGPRTVRYSDPPSQRQLGGNTVQGFRAVSLDPLNAEERSRFIGVIAWIVHHHDGIPFDIRNAVELSAFGLMCKLDLFCGGRHILLGELQNPVVYESLTLLPVDPSEPEQIELGKKEIAGFFAGILAKVTSSQPFEIRTPFELHCLHRLAALKLRCGQDSIRLHQLSDSRIYEGLHIGKEAIG